MQRRDRFLSPVGSSFWTFSSSPHTFNPLPSNSLLPSTLLNWATHSEPLLLHPSPSISTLSHISRWSRAGTGSPPHRDCTTAMSNFWRKISLRLFFFSSEKKVQNDLMLPSSLPVISVWDSPVPGRAGLDHWLSTSRTKSKFLDRNKKSILRTQKKKKKKPQVCLGAALVAFPISHAGVLCVHGPRAEGPAQRRAQQAERHQPQHSEPGPRPLPHRGPDSSQPGLLHPPLPPQPQGVHRQAHRHEVPVRRLMVETVWGSGVRKEGEVCLV